MQKNMLQFFAGLLLGSIAITAALKKVINKDNMSKVACLAFTISVICAIMMFSRGEIKLCASYWTYCILCYLCFLWLFAQIMQICWFKTKFGSLVDSYFAKSHLSQISFNLICHNIYIILFTTAFLCLSLIFSVYFINLIQLMNEPNFFLCLTMVLFSLFVLYLADLLMKSYLKQQAIRRKLFHLGPLVVVPIVHFLNISILLAFLSGGFYLFLLLEIIRYSLKNLNNLTNGKPKSESKVLNKQNLMLQSMKPLFVWMSDFNSRQKQFWFTHLFLIASLLLSYSFQLATDHVFRTSQHIGLFVIAADGMAALVGKRYGQLRIYGEKTLEGTLAFLVTFWVFIYSMGECSSLELRVVLSLGCGLGELLGGDADNISTLIIYYSLMIGYSTLA